MFKNFHKQEEACVVALPVIANHLVASMSVIDFLTAASTPPTRDVSLGISAIWPTPPLLGCRYRLKGYIDACLFECLPAE
jgi:hypothetical protein